MKRTILFSFFLCLFAFSVNAQTTEEMDEMARQEGLLQASVAKSDMQHDLNKSLDRYEIAVNANDALEMKELESVIATQLDAMINIQSDPAEKTKQTSLLRSFQTMNTNDKEVFNDMVTKLRTIIE